MTEATFDEATNTVAKLRAVMQDYQLSPYDIAVRIPTTAQAIYGWLHGARPTKPNQRAIQRTIRHIQREGAGQRQEINRSARINALFERLKGTISRDEMNGLLARVSEPGFTRQGHLAALEELAKAHGIDMNEEPEPDAPKAEAA